MQTKIAHNYDIEEIWLEDKGSRLIAIGFQIKRWLWRDVLGPLKLGLGSGLCWVDLQNRPSGQFKMSVAETAEAQAAVLLDENTSR